MKSCRKKIGKFISYNILYQEAVRECGPQNWGSKTEKTIVAPAEEREERNAPCADAGVLLWQLAAQ